jgi:ectoine hydroxylase-related dioxygenase (phytanoyl-CoA dioxygenase family)
MDTTWEDLRTKGYCVVKSVVSVERCKELENEFFDYMENLQPKFKRNDQTTWTNELLPTRTRGLLQHYAVGTQAHAVHARTECLPIFQALFPEQELTCSFDGTSFAPRPKVFKFADLKDWENKQRQKEAVHIDQTTEGFCSIQGGLALVDQPLDSKVFVVMEGSHHHHEKIMQIQKERRVREKEEILAQISMNTPEKKKLLAKLRQYPKGDVPVWYDENWLIMTDEMMDYLEQENITRKRISLDTGDLVLWDSRCVHASADFTKRSIPNSYRLQVFVSFAPRLPNGVEYDREIKKRTNAFFSGRTSKHSAQILRLFPIAPRTYGKRETLESVYSYEELTEEEKKFHGLIHY